ncbi:MAG: type II secretion system protein [Planctomycetota bacterium]
MAATIEKRPLVLLAPARGKGFTLIELLVVVGIIAVLMGLLLPVFNSVSKNKPLVMARAEVKAICAAMDAYFEALGCYPPDTDDYQTGNNPEDPTSIDHAMICKYLGVEIQDSRTKKKYGPFFSIEWNDHKRIRNWKSNNPDDWIFLDPWGNPYNVDAVHTIVTSDASTGKVTVQLVGEPYPSGMADETLKIDKVRVWSNGPDGQMVNGSKVDSGKGPAPEDQDNITSWAD